MEQMRLSPLSLGSSAVSTGLQARRTAYRCLSAFEQSRGIVLGFIIDCRATENLRGLREINRKLYDKLDQLRTRLDTGTQPLEGAFGADIDLLGSWKSGMAEEADKRQRIDDVNELEKTIQDLRCQPGFERFQLPPSYETLVKMAEDGPVVVEVCTHIRSDAIIITSSGIKSIRLPHLEYNVAKRKIKQLNAKIIPGGYTTYRSRSIKMESFLQWLWDVAVKDVIKELKRQGIVSENLDASALPRIWWIGADFLNFAPFHAAGYHSPGSTENTIHYAMGSYIPTLKALTYAREKPLKFLEPGSSLLMVAMPDTPGQSQLSSVNDEIAELASLVPEGIRTEVLMNPTAKETLERLPSSIAAHFACHGIPDPKDPFNSRLLLQLDEDGNSVVDNLTAGAISGINMQQAQIAYLSACSTARTVEKSANDPIHIASAFQLAGFSHVLANMWPAEDGACLKVSTEFYRNLFDGSPSGDASGHRKVSASFHHAVKKLRDSNPKLPLLWSPFIHTGG